MSYCSLSLYSNITPVRCTYASKQAQFCFTEFYRVKQKQKKQKNNNNSNNKNLCTHTYRLYQTIEHVPNQTIQPS